VTFAIHHYSPIAYYPPPAEEENGKYHQTEGVYTTGDEAREEKNAIIS